MDGMLPASVSAPSKPQEELLSMKKHIGTLLVVWMALTTFPAQAHAGWFTCENGSWEWSWSLWDWGCQCDPGWETTPSSWIDQCTTRSDGEASQPAWKATSDCPWICRQGSWWEPDAYAKPACCTETRGSPYDNCERETCACDATCRGCCD